MPEGFYKEVCKEIKAHGFSYKENAKGSHEKWQNSEGRVVLVPRNLKSRHTANGIMKDAGCDKRF